MVLALAVLALAVLGCAPTASVAPSPPPSAAPTVSLSPAEAIAAVKVSASVANRSLVATTAVADFGIEEGVRLVRVRILDDLRLDVRIETDTTIALAGSPVVCLVGPYPAPDDAGLTDRCWGDPDLAALVADQLPTDAAGRPTLEAGQPVVVSAGLSRGDARCDYPPGEWQLEVTLTPVGDGGAATPAPIELEPIRIDIPPTTDEPLELFTVGTRYCGIATVVYRAQGEPPVLP